MQTRSSFALGCALGVAVASGAFLWRWPEPAPADRGQERAEEREPGTVARLPVFTPPPACLTRDELRAELAAVEGRQRAAAAEAPTPELARPAPAPSPESAAALAQASRLIDQALASRRLVEQDSVSLTALAPRLADKDRNELRQRLIVAANRDQLEVDLAELQF